MEAFFAYFGFITVTKLRIPAELCKNPLKKKCYRTRKRRGPKSQVDILALNGTYYYTMLYI